MQEQSTLDALTAMVIAGAAVAAVVLMGLHWYARRLEKRLRMARRVGGEASLRRQRPKR